MRMTCVNSTARPKSVYLVVVGLSIFSLSLLVFGLIPYPYPSQPWTNHATNLVLSAGLMYYIRAIATRNLIAAAMVAVSLFISILMSISLSAATILSLIPWVFLLWPSNIRWLKANSHFSFVRLIVLGILVCICGVLYFTPSFSERDISNLYPIRLFAPGDAPIHALDESRQRTYACWEHGGHSGTCRVQYDENNQCCSMFWEKLAVDFKTGERYETFVAAVKDECEKRFGDIKWSEAVTDDGCIMVLGQARDDLTAKIIPNENMFVMGSVMVYSPRLCHEPSRQEIEMFNEMGNRIQRLWNESYTAVERGVPPEEVAKNYCQKMRSINPAGYCDELAAATLFRTHSVYGQQYGDVVCAFCEVWERNTRILLDKTSDDYILRGTSGCQECLVTIRQALDKWALELDLFYKRMEGAGRIFCAGEIEIAFESYQKGLLGARQTHLDILKLFCRQYEILQAFAHNGRDTPNGTALIDEFSSNQERIKLMAKVLDRKSIGMIAGSIDCDNRQSTSVDEKTSSEEN